MDLQTVLVWLFGVPVGLWVLMVFLGWLFTRETLFERIARQQRKEATHADTD